MNGKRLSVHIDRLVLRGIDLSNQQAFEKGLKTELARVLGNSQFHDLHVPGTAVMRLGRLPLQPGQAGAGMLGKGVARAIGKGLKP
jgi:hypothetical protein